MALAVPRYTVRDLASFPDDGNRYELLDGLLLVTPAPAPAHQAVVTRLVMMLGDYLRPAGAQVYTPGSVEVEPNVHLEPDVLVVPSSEPIGQSWGEIKRWWLAVEVSGRGSQVYDRDFKFAAYTALGVRDVWRVDLRDRCVVTRSGTTRSHTHRDHFRWHPAELESAITIDVHALFAGVTGDQ